MAGSVTGPSHERTFKPTAKVLQTMKTAHSEYDTHLSKPATLWTTCKGGGSTPSGSRNTAFARNTAFGLSPYSLLLLGGLGRSKHSFFLTINSFLFFYYTFTPFYEKLYIRGVKRVKREKVNKKNSIYNNIGEGVVSQSVKKGERRPAR